MNSTEKFKRVMDILGKYDIGNSTTTHSFFKNFKDEDFDNEVKIAETIKSIEALEKRMENNFNKYSENIMRTLRQRQGLDEFDTSKDEIISEMEPDSVFEEVCSWNGLVGFDYTIKSWISDIYGINI